MCTCNCCVKGQTKCHESDEKPLSKLNEELQFIVVVEKSSGLEDAVCCDSKPKQDNLNPNLIYPGYNDTRQPALKSSYPENKPTKEMTSNLSDVHLSPAISTKGKGKNLKKSGSQELRGGILHVGCTCSRRNGLQDDCQRRECGGRPECTSTEPGPCCGPSLSPKPT